MNIELCIYYSDGFKMEFLLFIIFILIIVIIIQSIRSKSKKTPSSNSFNDLSPAMQKKMLYHGRIADRMIENARRNVEKRENEEQSPYNPHSTEDWNDLFWQFVNKGNCFRQRRFLTERELIFFNKLIRNYGKYYSIHCQVDLASLVDTGYQFDRDSQENRILFGIVNRFRIDFVLYSRQHKRVIAAVELDDNTHTLPARIERDKKLNMIMQQAGIPLLRITDLNQELPIPLH